MRTEHFLATVLLFSPLSAGFTTLPRGPSAVTKSRSKILRLQPPLAMETVRRNRWRRWWRKERVNEELDSQSAGKGEGETDVVEAALLFAASTALVGVAPLIKAATVGASIVGAAEVLVTDEAAAAPSQPSPRPRARRVPSLARKERARTKKSQAGAASTVAATGEGREENPALTAVLFIAVVISLIGGPDGGAARGPDLGGFLFLALPLLILLALSADPAMESSAVAATEPVVVATTELGAVVATEPVVVAATESVAVAAEEPVLAAGDDVAVVLSNAQKQLAALAEQRAQTKARQAMIKESRAEAARVPPPASPLELARKVKAGKPQSASELAKLLAADASPAELASQVAESAAAERALQSEIDELQLELQARKTAQKAPAPGGNVSTGLRWASRPERLRRGALVAVASCAAAALLRTTPPGAWIEAFLAATLSSAASLVRLSPMPVLP